LLAGLSTLHSASTSIATASRLTGHPGSRQSATDAPIGEPHLTTNRMVVSRLAKLTFPTLTAPEPSFRVSAVTGAMIGTNSCGSNEGID
jgi:hypothetical protein